MNMTHTYDVLANIVTRFPHKIVRGDKIVIYDERRVRIANVYVNDDASCRVALTRRAFVAGVVVEFDDAGHIEIN